MLASALGGTVCAGGDKRCQILGYDVSNEVQQQIAAESLCAEDTKLKHLISRSS